MANNKIDNLTIEGARIMFRNFSGKEGKFNRAGDRNFCVIIDDPDMVKKLAKDGWNIKVWQPKDEDSEPVNYIPVKLRYDMVPPKVYRISSITGKQVLMTEDMIDAFDSEDFRNVDLILHPYPWEINGKTGVTAYVKTMYVTVEEDALAAKYAVKGDRPYDAVGPNEESGLPF